MRLDVVAPLDLTAYEVSTWEGLQSADPAFDSPYLSPHWCRAAAAVEGPDARGGRVVVIRDGEEPVGFLPVRVARFTALPVGAPMCDYQAVVRAPGVRVDPRAVVKALSVARFDFSHFLADQADFARFIQGASSSQIVRLADGYEAYAEGRRASGHSILKDAAKKLRKLERDLGPVRFTPMSDRGEDFERLVELKRAQYRATRQTDIFDAGWTHQLLRNLFELRSPGFGGALFTLHAGDRLAAAHFALRGRRTLHAWFLAHDHAFDRYSPGVLLIDQILRWQCENGFEELDLGPGDYRFKFQLANRTREVGHGFVGTASPATLVRSAQYRVRHAAEALPLGPVSALPGKAMRRLDLWRGLR